MLPPSETAILTRRFQMAIAKVGERAARLTAAAWLQLDSRDEADVPDFVEATAPYRSAAKAAAVNLGSGYYSAIFQVAAPSINPDLIDVTDQTRDPFIAYWRALKQQRGLEAALEAGAARSQAVARNLVVSASRRTGDRVAEQTGQRIAGWKRTLDGGACDWCRGLTDLRFRTAESADFGHDRCGCTAAPVPA